MGSMLNINQLARKENLVIHLDASVANYTAYEFNSGSRTGTSASILDWPNRWTDLSGNNNHGYVAIPTSVGNAITNYKSSCYDITSSYLNNGVNVVGNGLITTPTDKFIRFNPITSPEEGSFSIFTWIKFNTNTSTFTGGPTNYTSRPQWIVQKANIGSYIWALSCAQPTNSGPLYPIFEISPYISNTNIKATSVSIPTGSWCQIGVTVESGSLASDAIKIYFNGQVVKTNPGPTSWATANQQITIGRPDWSSNTIRSNFNMSQLLIYNTALTPQEVWDNYQITKYKHQT